MYLWLTSCNFAGQVHWIMWISFINLSQTQWTQNISYIVINNIDIIKFYEILHFTLHGNILLNLNCFSLIILLQNWSWNVLIYISWHISHKTSNLNIHFNSNLDSKYLTTFRILINKSCYHNYGSRAFIRTCIK